MPRSGTESEYDVMPVCAFCIDYLIREYYGGEAFDTSPSHALDRTSHGCRKGVSAHGTFGLAEGLH